MDKNNQESVLTVPRMTELWAQSQYNFAQYGRAIEGELAAGAARQGGNTSEDTSTNSAASLASQSQAAQPSDDLTDVHIEEARREGERRGRAVMDNHLQMMETNRHYRERVFNAIVEHDAKEGLHRFAHLAGQSQATKAQAEPVRAEVVERFTDYSKIAHLIGSIFFAGDFKAETANERELEALLVKTGHRYASWDEIATFRADDLPVEFLAAAPQAPVAMAEPTAWLATDLDGRGDVGFTKEEAKRRAGEGCTEFFPLYDLAVAPVAATKEAESVQAEGVQANVLPPFAAPAGQLGAGNPVVKYETVLLAGDHGRINDSTIREAMEQEIKEHRARAEELASRFRAQGGVTNTNDSGSDRAPTTSTVSAPAEGKRAFDTLYGAVMNIPCNAIAGWERIAVNHYKLGHRDARHAAVDLIAEFAGRFRAPADALPARRYEHVNGFADATHVEFARGSEKGYGVLLDGGRGRVAYSRDEAASFVLGGHWREVAEGAQAAPQEVRNQALEEAVVEVAMCAQHDTDPLAIAALNVAVKKIRALKRTTSTGSAA